jgi:hypothetical protein
MRRRSFVEGLAGAVGISSLVGWSSPYRGQPIAPGSAPPGFPRQDPAEVEAVVGASHADLARVRQLVDARPALAKSAWDWGYGDWETTLGAASHMGRRDIALYLLEQGAIPTMFSAAMLGQIAVLRAFVEATPGCQSTPGPHGITLLAHARAGGDSARSTVQYLEQLGGADVRPALLSLDAAARAKYCGTFASREAAGLRLVVSESRGALVIARENGTPRNLLATAEHLFYPTGAPAVRISFVFEQDRVLSLRILDGALELIAERVA